jgi:hypothetical protein
MWTKLLVASKAEDRSFNLGVHPPRAAEWSAGPVDEAFFSLYLIATPPFVDRRSRNAELASHYCS